MKQINRLLPRTTVNCDNPKMFRLCVALAVPPRAYHICTPSPQSPSCSCSR